MAFGGGTFGKSPGSRPEEMWGQVTTEALITAKCAASSKNVPLEDFLALQEELVALRQEQAKLRQAIFEAAQAQRRLCAPRQLSWREFEIAGEIFPVRHLSGDFFKVLDLGDALGLAVGDIAGKGLSAGIWLPHLTGVVQRWARAHSDPAAALAEINRELCDDEGGSSPDGSVFCSDRASAGRDRVLQRRIAGAFDSAPRQVGRAVGRRRPNAGCLARGRV